LLVRTLTQVNLVPQSAVQRNNDAAFVYVVQPDGTVKSQNVKILASEGEVSAISGVQPAQNVVTDGFDKLQSGSKVAVRTPAANAGNGAKGSKDGNGAKPNKSGTDQGAAANGGATQTG
jgi:multidrug efflux system membrane fusion protein